MAHPNLPAGCHDADTAAQLLHMSKVALLQKLRELGWINTGGGKSNHNLPRREFTQNGYLCTQDRGYCLKGKKEISKTYRVMLLTQLGFNALKIELGKPPAAPALIEETPTAVVAHLPKVAPVPAEVITEPAAPFDREAADKEREQVMAQMREWGIAS